MLGHTGRRWAKLRSIAGRQRQRLGLSLEGAGLYCCLLFVFYEQPIDQESQPYEKRDHAGHPNPADDLGGVAWHVRAGDDSLHEDEQENHQCYADEGSDYTGLDLLMTSRFGCDPALPVEFFLT